MNDESRSTSSEPQAAVDGWSASAPAATPAADHHIGQPVEPAAAFTGRTPRKTAGIRAGIVLGTGLLVVLGAAVAMGASPSASPAAGGQAPTVPGPAAAGPGRPGVDFGFGPGGPGDPGGPKGGPGRGDGRGFGAISVTAVDGSKVALATADGWTRTITLTSTTKITKGGAAATASDLKVGDTIRFRQTRNADGTYAITAIEIVEAQTAGTVTAVGGDTITITLRDGTSQTVRTTGSTAYRVERADGTRAAVTVGSIVVASGDKNADGSLTATSVWVRLPHVAGTVTTTTANSVTLTRRDGTTVTIHIGSATTIRVAGVEKAKLSDVKAGMGIVVEGTQRADGSIDATAIGAGNRMKVRANDGHKGAKPDASAAPGASAGTDG